MGRLVPLVIFMNINGVKNQRVQIGDVEIGDTGLMTGQITTALFIEDDGVVHEVDPMYVNLTKI